MALAKRIGLFHNGQCLISPGQEQETSGPRVLSRLTKSHRGTRRAVEDVNLAWLRHHEELFAVGNSKIGLIVFSLMLRLRR